MRTVGFLLTLVFLLASLSLARAGDEEDIPSQLTAFICQTGPGHYIADMAKLGVEVMPSPNWKDLDWVVSKDMGVSLKICHKLYLDVHDEDGDFLAIKDHPIPLHPNIADEMVCSYMGMLAKNPHASGDPGDFGGGYYVYKIGCPQKMYDEQGNVARNKNGHIMYSDPPCPPDCDCIDEEGAI